MVEGVECSRREGDSPATILTRSISHSGKDNTLVKLKLLPHHESETLIWWFSLLFLFCPSVLLTTLSMMTSFWPYTLDVALRLIAMIGY